MTRMLTQLLDWNKYKSERVHKMLEGGDYDYNAAKVLKGDFKELWELLDRHYNRALDLKWSAYSIVFPFYLPSFIPTYI